MTECSLQELLGKHTSTGGCRNIPALVGRQAPASLQEPVRGPHRGWAAGRGCLMLLPVLGLVPFPLQAPGSLLYGQKRMHLFWKGVDTWERVCGEGRGGVRAFKGRDLPRLGHPRSCPGGCPSCC